jgi:serine/threonine-protein kinase
VIEDPIPPIRERNPAADVADELDALVMRCLDKEPTARFADGSALAHALEAILEGSRRRAQAEDLARKGLARASAYARAAEATADAERTFAELRSQTPLWASTGDRALVWDQEARYRDLRKLRDDSYDEAVSLLLSALERDRTLSEARSGLASLYVRRLDEAEARGDLAAARFFRSQVIRHDDGALTHLLIGASSLQFDAGAEFELTLRPWEDGGPRLVLGDGEALGTTRSLDLPLRAGRYLLSARADGFAPVDVPLYADRPASHPVFVPAIRDLPDGFIVIVAGRYLRGGDPGAADGGRREAVDVDGFAIAKHPVSQREFARFLRDGGADSGFAVWGGPDDLSPEDRAFLPALGVTFEAATAYCAWLGKRLSRAVRLPTADEWEKAARGVDGRIFPWGDRWEPAFCACGESSPGDPRPEPIGGRRDDCSPYGVMDLAGGVHEWVTDPVPHRPERGFLRGGAWNAPAQASRLAGRLSLPRTTRSGAVGFRVAIDLSIPRSDRAADYSDLSHDRML